jgi:hypothetical protein
MSNYINILTDKKRYLATIKFSLKEHLKRNICSALTDIYHPDPYTRITDNNTKGLNIHDIDKVVEKIFQGNPSELIMTLTQNDPEHLIVKTLETHRLLIEYTNIYIY